jgi:hypothetical protein
VIPPIDVEDVPGPSRPPCGDRSARRRLVRDDPDRFGVDFVEVEPTADGEPPRLRVGLLEATLPDRLGDGNFRFEGGERIPGSALRVVHVEGCASGDRNVPAAVLVTLNRRGDFARYVLRLVEADRRRPGEPTDVPLRGVDPVFDRAAFRFPPPPDCDDGVEADCALAPAPRPAVPDPPGGPAVIDYLARDYDGLRDMMLRRLGLTLPHWTDRHASDLMVTLVELIAYTGDRLSYAQDAVATEPYLSIARRRISVRRLARLIDYRVSEGCASRAWVSLIVGSPTPIDLAAHSVRFRTAPDPTRPRGAVDDGSLVFEPVTPTLGPTKVLLDPAMNVLSFYSWGDSVCRLPEGATSATLWRGPGQFPPDEPAPAPPPPYAGPSYPTAEVYAPPGPLPPPAAPPPAPKAGDVLIFVEALGPRTGVPTDADPRHRHAVRLTGVREQEDPVRGATVWEVAWDHADRLPFPLTISALVPVEEPFGGTPPPGRRPTDCVLVPDVTVAWGNVLLVEHGATQPPGPVFTAPAAAYPPAECLDAGPPLYPPPPTPPFRPELPLGPLTHAEPFPRPDLVALRQAHALRRFRTRLADVFRDARAGLLTGRGPIREGGPRAWLLDRCVGRRALGRAGFAFAAHRPHHRDETAHQRHQRHEAIRAERDAQAAALLRLEAQPGAHHLEILRRLDTVIARLEHGRALSEADQAQFAQVLGLDEHATGDVALLGSLGLAWDSPRWYGPAAEATSPDPSRAIPAVALEESAEDGEVADPPVVWRAVPDLLSSGPDDRDFVAEIDDDSRAILRFAPAPSGVSAFGDADALGRTPAPGRSFVATYRVGRGTIGNIPADALVRADGVAAAVRQPLPARGGADPEPLEHVRRVAPGAIVGRIERAITPDDYATLALRHPGVALAAAERVDDGLLTQVVVAVAAVGGDDATPELIEQVAALLESYRRINHAVAVVPATYVAIALTIRYRVAADAQAGHVRAALLDVFSPGHSALRAGGRGYFHPDLWPFGRSVEIAPIVAAARSVPGVEDAAVTGLVRIDPPGGASDVASVGRDAVLPIGPREIVRLRNDPSLPERGLLRLVLVDATTPICDPPAAAKTGEIP